MDQIYVYIRRYGIWQYFDGM